MWKVGQEFRAWGRANLSRAGKNGRSGSVGLSIGSGRDDRTAMTDGMVEVTQERRLGEMRVRCQMAAVCLVTEGR